MIKIKTYELEFDGRNNFIKKIEDSYISEAYIVAIKPMDTEVIDPNKVANGNLYQIYLTNCIVIADEPTVKHLMGEGD